MKLRIKEIRQGLGWTQKHLAEMAGVSVPFLSQIETGKREAALQTLEDIACALELKVVDLFIDESNEDERRLRSAIDNLSESDLQRLIQFAETLAATQQD